MNTNFRVFLCRVDPLNQMFIKEQYPEFKYPWLEMVIDNINISEELESMN